MDISKVENLIMMDIDNKVCELLSKKPEGKKFIEWQEMDHLCNFAENIWVSKCGAVPRQIQAVSLIARAALEPDRTRKIQLCKDALVIGGGVSGIAAIIGAICTALGVGVGVWGTIVAFFAGISWTGPLAVAALGVVAVALAGYLMFNNIPAQKMSDRALAALKDGTKKALPEVWPDFESKWKD